MAETGWPLIPREVLPAPVPAARPARRPLPGVAHPDLGRQLSIFGAETTETSPADLVGLLAGPGRLGRMGGTARVSVRVDAAWRVHVLVDELVRRGLVATWHPVEDPQINPFDGTAYPPPTADDTSDQHSEPPEAQEYDEEPASAVIGGTHRAEVPPTPPDEADADTADAATADVDTSVTESSVTESSVTESSVTDTSETETIGTSADETSAGGTSAGGTSADETSADETSADGLAAAQADVTYFEVRTAYSNRLSGLARAWPAAAGQLFLSGPRLRLWVAARSGSRRRRPGRNGTRWQGVG